MSSPAVIRVLCVDDSAEITRLYERALERETDLQCVGTLNSADALVEAARRLSPDVVLLDLNMPGREPLEAIEELTGAAPQCKVLAFTGDDGPVSVDRAVQAGAWGLVSKHGDLDAVIAAIRRVSRGEMVMPQ